MCDLLGKSEPVSQVDIEDIRTPTPVSLDIEDIRTPTPVSLDIEDIMPPSVRQMPQGKRRGRLGQLSHIAFAHIPALNMCIL